MSRPSVAYVVSRWGEPTQTFVRREAAAVADGGCAVSVFSLKRPVAENAANMDVHWLRPVEILAGSLAALRAHPRGCLHLVVTVIRRSRPRNILPQLAALLIGTAWAGRGLAANRHLHAHFGWVSSTAAWAAATVADRPYSVVLHAFELHDRRRLDRFTAVPLEEASRVFTISERDCDIVRQRWGIDAAVLHMGVPRAWTTSNEEGSSDRDPWLIVSVGSLVPKKGYSLLLEAMTRTDARWRLVVIGAGPMQCDLEEQINRLGLQERVRLLGSLREDQVRVWLRRAALSCLASVETPDGDRDGIPVALMEAMACGAAVVSTDVGAIRELVDGAGLLVPPRDPVAFASAIDRLRDDEFRRRTVEAGRSRVVASFVSETAARPVVDLVSGGRKSGRVSA